MRNLCNLAMATYGFSDAQHAADAAAGAGVELDEIQLTDAFVFNLLQNADDVFDAVRREIFFF